MDREREKLAKEIEKVVRPRIERVIKGLEELERVEMGGLAGSEAFILLSSYMLFNSSERLNKLTKILMILTVVLTVLTALSVIVAFR